MLQGKIPSYALEKRYVGKDGRVIWTLLNVALVRDDKGNPSYFIGQIQDISVRKASELAVVAAQKMVVAAAEGKSRFLATMSHEIRTPMNGIVGMTELLSLSKLDDEQERYVEVVRDSGQSLLRVLDDILDYSKIEAGKLELENLDFDLLEQIRSVAMLMELQFANKGVLQSTQVQPGLPVDLNGDPGRLRQILMNLVGNALKFTPPGGSVTISVAGDVRTGCDRAAAVFRDRHSLGIAGDARQRLFRPFSQADDSTTRKYGGTGLGLSICKQLVDLMGGEIEVDSSLGAGSTFWFVIPYQRGRRTERSTERRRHPNGRARPKAAARSERLLLVEDNEVNKLLATKQFETLGFNITVVVERSRGRRGRRKRTLRPHIHGLQHAGARRLRSDESDSSLRRRRDRARSNRRHDGERTCGRSRSLFCGRYGRFRIEAGTHRRFRSGSRSLVIARAAYALIERGRCRRTNVAASGRGIV